MEDVLLLSMPNVAERFGDLGAQAVHLPHLTKLTIAAPKGLARGH